MIDRQTVLGIAVIAPADERTVRRVLQRKPTQIQTRERIERAIIALGLSSLLAKPVEDPDAAEDLDR